MKNAFLKHKKLISAVSFCLFFAVYALYCVGLFLRVGIDSDYSNLVLEATDILSGNFFLSGWNMTGISFITTDLLYFVAGVLVAGSTIRAYFVAVTLMFLTLFLGAVLLLKTGENGVKPGDLLVLLAVAGIPNVFSAGILRAHTAVPAYVFLALFCGTMAFRAHKNNKKRSVVLWLAGFTLLLALGCAGDPLTLIIGAAPVVLALVWLILGKNPQNVRFSLAVIGCTAGSAVLGTLIEKLYILAGGVNKNTFLEMKSFCTLEQLEEKFRIYLTAVLEMFGANFLGKPLVSIDTLWYFLRTLLVIFVFYIIIRNIIDFLMRKECDLISVILSLGFALISFLCIFTEVLVNIHTARYFAYLPMMSAVLIVRYFKFHKPLEKKIFSGKISMKIPAYLLAGVLLASSIAPVSFVRTGQFQDRLGRFLEENGLEYGYAKFWNASHVTLATEGRVKVRSVLSDGNVFGKYVWFCKDEWYEPEYANFVIVDLDENKDGFGTTETAALNAFGEPSERLVFENVVICVYDYDISDKILR